MADFHVKRCFVALLLDDAARADCAELAASVYIDGLRLVQRQNLHVTLKFLGDVDDPDQPRLIEALRAAAIRATRFELHVTGVEYLPTPRRPRVLAAQTDRPDPLLALFDLVEEAALALGFPREGRAYHPHVTLGRFRSLPRRLPIPETFECETIRFPIDRLVLLQSELSHAGPTYTPLAEFPLNGEGALPTRP